MTDTETQQALLPDETVAGEGVGGVIKALIEDGQTLIEAEIAYRKAQAAYGLGQAKAIAVLIVLGLAFGFFTLLAIVVGLLLALAAIVGVWGALAIVGGVLALLAGACLLLAVRRISRAKAALGSGGPTA
jgi:Putative Actinobacterial Holin-X, holin superfamily III